MTSSEATSVTVPAEKSSAAPYAEKKPTKPKKSLAVLWLQLIGWTKLAKAIGFVLLAFGVHQWMAPAMHDRILNWINDLRADPHNHLLYELLEKMLAVPEKTLRLFRIGFYVYAVLYTIEGTGLILKKHWAEWMVVVTTSGLLPFEIYEIFHHATWLKAVALILNLAVVGFLIWYLARKPDVKKA